ncbi:MAG: hypothetical protein L6R40_005831 [Gallowayella cf. fulva]|nr:MAG: hypothetical protein L6R40_005831 [Xanthomendoza cf. fulva]
MNWTGGSLSRSRKHNTNLSVKQKQHFAKVRGKLLDGRRPLQRIEFPFAQHDEHNGRGPGSITHNSRREKQSTQMTLEEFENVRPLAKQLQSLRPRHALPTTSRSHLSVSQPPSASPECLRTSLPQTKEPPCDASRSRREAKPGTNRSLTPNSAPPRAFDELEAKRRELLESYDWVGLEKLEPVKMKFADAADRDLIGKRRIVKGFPNTGVQVAHQHRRPIIDADEKLNMMRASSNILSSPEKISVHIGSSHERSSVRRGDHDISIHTNGRQAPAPEEMALDNERSSRTGMHSSATQYNIAHQSTDMSDEMLFDQEWSNHLPRLQHEPASMSRGPYKQAAHPNAEVVAYPGNLPSTYTISSGSESSCLLQDQEVEQDFDKHRARRCSRSYSPRFPSSSERAVHEVTNIFRLDPGDRFNITKKPSFPAPKCRDDKEPGVEPQSTPSYDEEVVGIHHATQPKPPSQAVRLCHFDHKVVGDVMNAFPSVKECFNNTNSTGKHESDSHSTEANFETAWREFIQTQGTTKEHEESNISPSRRIDSATHLPKPLAHEQTVDAGAVQFAVNTALPPPSPVPIRENQPQAPADATPEEDELLWRTFVFGTSDPTQDWTFDNATVDPVPKPGRKDSSSPLRPLFEASNDNAESNSPISKTQPSLLVEASSPSPSPNDIPLNAVDIAPSKSSSPPRTQHSMQAQPSSSSPQPRLANHPPLVHNQSTMSSDPLSFSPSRILAPPAVVFTKPNRYVGESQGSLLQVRLGGGRRKKKRGRRGSEDEDEDGMFEESQRATRRGKKGRRDREWGGVADTQEEGWEERDEIVD